MSERTKTSRGRAHHAGGAWRHSGLILACLFPLLLAACYELGEEVIDPGMAEAVPTLPGRYSLGEGAFTVVTAQTDGNDYRYEETDSSGETSAGSFRVIHLSDDLYLAQVMPDDGGIFAAYFRHPASWSLIPLTTTSAVIELAALYHVEIDADMADILIGFRRDILAFLTAHTAEHLTE